MQRPKGKRSREEKEIPELHGSFSLLGLMRIDERSVNRYNKIAERRDEHDDTIKAPEGVKILGVDTVMQALSVLF